jgi:cytochrome c peroxidase
MRKSTLAIAFTAFAIFLAISCTKKDTLQADAYKAIAAAFGTNINPDNLQNYASQTIPAYIRKDNTAGNTITDAKATLGRVLFYDKNLSIDNSISCGSCHKQEFAFSDTALISKGVQGGVTGRHSMRLVNARFAVETKFFWNERAATLEKQTTTPIQDHAEMGFSGQNGRPDINTLIGKLQAIDYYNELFKFVYGDGIITEARMQECLAQFVRSIQSFDSKYDAGRALVPNDGVAFPNFTAVENTGKQLFLTPPVFNAAGIRIGGGLGCNGCHNAPEFDIDPNSGNNGNVAIINNTGRDLDNTRAPSLRDLTRADGTVNSLMMHNGGFKGLRAVLNHYNSINNNPTQNPNLDQRLKPNGIGQTLNLTEDEIVAVTLFLQTLGGKNVYTDSKWSNPFR